MQLRNPFKRKVKSCTAPAFIKTKKGRLINPNLIRSKQLLKMRFQKGIGPVQLSSEKQVNYFLKKFKVIPVILGGKKINVPLHNLRGLNAIKTNAGFKLIGFYGKTSDLLQCGVECKMFNSTTNSWVYIGQFELVGNFRKIDLEFKRKGIATKALELAENNFASNIPKPEYLFLNTRKLEVLNLLLKCGWKPETESEEKDIIQNRFTKDFGAPIYLEKLIVPIKKSNYNNTEQFIEVESVEKNGKIKTIVIDKGKLCIIKKQEK